MTSVYKLKVVHHGHRSVRFHCTSTPAVFGYEQEELLDIAWPIDNIMGYYGSIGKERFAGRVH